MQNLGQSGPNNCDLLLIACSKFVPKSFHQIALLQFQKYKIFQLSRNCRWRATKSSPQMSKIDLRLWAPTCTDWKIEKKHEAASKICKDNV